jgi:hypothetical protein
MQRRLKFSCWNCKQEYSLLREVEGRPKLLVECPFCEHEAVVDLAPYRDETTTVMRGDKSRLPTGAPGITIPDVLPTRRRTAADDAAWEG